MGVLKRIILILCTVSMLIPSLLSSLFLLPALVFAGTCWDGGYSGVAPWAVKSAANHNVDSVGYADINYCVNTVAASGDTVNIPSGSATWATGLNLTKAVRLVGADTWPDPTDETTYVSNTLITNNSSTQLITISPSSPADNPYIEITGLTLIANSAGTKGGIHVYCVNTEHYYTNFRIHHNHIRDAVSGTGINVFGYSYGLIDHNYLYNNYQDIANEVTITAWTLYPKDGNGNLIFSSLGMGGPNFLFVENNIFKGSHSQEIVSSGGARTVVRYNTYRSPLRMIDIHGENEGSGMTASNMAAEAYNNVGTSPEPIGMMGLPKHRGGVALIYNNTGNVYANSVSRMGVAIGEGASLYCDTTANYRGYRQKPHNSYVWNNKNIADNLLQYTGTNLNGTDYDPLGCLTEQTDYYKDVLDNSHDRNTYFSYDVAANRNLTDCTTENVYWETDNKKLYRCTATNTWTLVYKPYIYPHPLQGISNKGATIINTIGGLNAINMVGGLNVINQ